MKAGEAVLGAGPIRAFHGSPHDFDAFDASKIGTGEGAQAYGHGLYFAENEGVAKSYRDALAGSTVDGQPFNPANPLHQAAARIDEQGTRAAALDEIDKRIAADPGDDMHPRVLSMLLHRPEIPPIRAASGKMYEVNINADPEHFLDWDKPLSEQHPSVQQAFAHEPPTQVGSEAFHKLQNALIENKILPNAPADAKLQHLQAQYLREAGIPGIKYLDQGSRTAGDGSRNYVVFNHDLINIMRKYGMGSIAALPPAALALAQQQEDPTQ